MAILSPSSEKSPLRRNEPAAVVCRSARSVSQARSARGSPDSILTGPLNPKPLDEVSKRPPSRTWVRPGTRNSSLSICQVSPSALNSALARWSVPPATVSASMLSPSLRGSGHRGASERATASALMAAIGRRRVSSGSATARSRSICGAESVPSTCGLLPKVSFALPRSLIARSSQPYWSSICSRSAAAAVAFDARGQESTAGR